MYDTALRNDPKLNQNTHNMPSNTYTQAVCIARERFNALNNLDMGDFNSFREYMEMYNTLWEQGMEMMNFARDIEEDTGLEEECESITDYDDDASSRNGQC